MIALNLGAGSKRIPPQWLGELQEIGVDLVAPADVVADVRALPFEPEYAALVYASHLIEHFTEDEVVPLLVEWRRVLKTGGRLVIECPDVQAVGLMIHHNGVDAVLYEAQNGALIRGQDVLFGWQVFVREGGEPMRHKVAFDARKLAWSLTQAGFEDGTVRQNVGAFSLTAEAVK